MITVNVFQQKSTLKVKELCIITHPFQKTLKNNKWHCTLYSDNVFIEGKCFHMMKGIGCVLCSRDFIYYYYFLIFCLFQGHSHGIWKFQGQWSNRSCSHRPKPEPLATWDPSRVCNLHHSSWQECQILNPLSKARDQTCNLMVPKSDLLTTAPQRELLFQRFLLSDNI